MTAAHSFSGQLAETDIRLTDSARQKMVELFNDVDEELEAIRVFVSGGGCGGMAYGMTFTEGRTPFDCVLEEDGFMIYVDAVALNFLRGVEIDFREGPMGSASFVFNNVFAATGGSGTCSACGAAGGGCA